MLVVDDDRDIRELLVALSAFDVFHHQMDVAAAVHPKPLLVDQVLDTVHRLAGRVAPWHACHSPEEKTN